MRQNARTARLVLRIWRSSPLLSRSLYFWIRQISSRASQHTTMSVDVVLCSIIPGMGSGSLSCRERCPKSTRGAEHQFPRMPKPVQRAAHVQFLCHFLLCLASYLFSCSCLRPSYLIPTSSNRHAPRRPRNISCNPPPQASHDVQCYVGEGYSSYLQEIHGKREPDLLLTIVTLP